MNSYCAVYKLAQDKTAEYVELHKNCWAEQKEALKEAGAMDMEIFVQDELCIIYYKCEDFDDFLSRLEKSPVNAKWQRLVNGCFEKRPSLVGRDRIRPAEKVFSLLDGKSETM